MIRQMPSILCVDDESVNLSLLRAVLTPHGYEVITADNGQAALEVLNKKHVDLVLLDVMMPGMDGFKVCRLIRESKNLMRVPVIMITSLTSKLDRIKGIEAGAEDFISKPFDQGEVLARIKMLLKMKGLVDDLHAAYTNISDLTAFSKTTLENFNPLSFDFLPQIDAVVTRIMSQTADDPEKPKIVLVGIKDQAWSWNQYELIYNNLGRALLQSKSSLSTIFNLPAKGKSKTIFYNAEDIPRSELQHFFDDLVSFNIMVSNAVCYLSRDICIIALNYGRKVSAYDASVLGSLVLDVLFLRSLSSQIKEVKNAFEYTVYALARATEADDQDTGNHILRVGEYSTILAKKLRMPDEFVRAIRVQATLHDVGKIHVPSAILMKPGKLTSDEFDEMKKHTLYGAKIIGDHVQLTMGRSIALTHHENFDGSGYPEGLIGAAIPIEGMIVRMADQYDSLRNARVYKPAFDHLRASDIIIRGDERTLPGHFDPRVLKAFQDTVRKFEKVYEELKYAATL
jgi:response regulator RpfG family c-di-GMP phosphodiesterase